MDIEKAIDELQAHIDGAKWVDVAYVDSVTVELLQTVLTALKAQQQPVNWIECQKAYSANGCKPVTLHDGLYEVEIRRCYDMAKGETL